MKIHTKDNSYKCALCGEGFISRNHLKRRMKGHAMDNPYPCALCVKKFISINHTKKRINSHTGIFHITVLFNIHEHGWQESISFLVLLLPEIFRFGNVICRQNFMGIPCYTKCAKHKCLLLVETGNKLLV